MITEHKIRKLAYLDVAALEKALQKNYPKDRVLQNRFLGISNGGQFCYEIMYWDRDEGDNVFTKVFVDLDPSEEPVAEY